MLSTGGEGKPELQTDLPQVSHASSGALAATSKDGRGVDARAAPLSLRLPGQPERIRAALWKPPRWSRQAADSALPASGAKASLLRMTSALAAARRVAPRRHELAAALRTFPRPLVACRASSPRRRPADSVTCGSMAERREPGRETRRDVSSSEVADAGRLGRAGGSGRPPLHGRVALGLTRLGALLGVIGLAIAAARSWSPRTWRAGSWASPSASAWRS
jgi:hypothetical protein